MQLQILPFVRLGAGAFRGTDDVVTPSLVVHRDAAVQAVPALPNLRLRGAGHVVALDPAVLSRRVPEPRAAEVPTHCFPHVELAEADLPWRYSPGKPDANGRLAPWLVLVVVERQEGVVLRPATRDLPATLSLRAGLAARELPALADRWAWAHVQTSQDLAKETPLPHLTFARLIAPRRLLPGKRYIVALVPALKAAAQAGRGEPVSAGSNEPAWTAETGELTLPAYDAWEFATSLEELDFEVLAGRIKATTEAPKNLGVRLVDVSHPGGGVKDPPLGASIRYCAPLTPEGATDEQNPVLVTLAKALKNRVASPLPNVNPKQDPEIVLPAYGGPKAPAELQTDVRWRIAAGLGRELVARHQEALVAEVWDQLAEQSAGERRASRGALSGEVGEAFAARLRKLPDELYLHATARMHAKVAQGDATVRAGLNTALHAGLTAPAMRRLLRTGSAAGRTLRVAAARTPLQTVTASFTGKQQTVLRFSPRRAAPIATAASTVVSAAVTTVKAAIQPRTRHEARTSARLGPAATLVNGAVKRPSPKLLQPLAQWLAALAPDLMLPGVAEIPQNSVLEIAADPRVVEALLAGANTALHDELAWRECPVDRRATLFDRFWEGSDRPDITPLAEWKPTLGKNGPGGADTTLLIRAENDPGGADTTLLIRAELLRLLPNVLVYGLGPDRQPMVPIRFGRLTDDTLYVGFAEQLGPKSPSWWLVIEEARDGLRFGVDAPPSSSSIEPPPSDPNQLHWGHLVADPAELASRTYAPAAIAGKSLKNAAQLARWFMQRPILLTIHTSMLQ